MNNKRIRVLSGIRASHSLHIGNLLGAINGMKRLQNDSKYETFYMVADLHGITTPFKPKDLEKNRLEVVMDYLASGIDPKKSALFLQADVSEHAEFAYYLSVAVTSNRLLHLPAYKEKIKQHKGYPRTMALLNYPVLMAADILLYKAEKVPIAKDQHSHLEVVRQIARNMNARYKLKFPEPKEFSLLKNMMVPSICGEGKMSKSKSGSSIFLNDSLEMIKEKVAGIPTDSSGKGFIKDLKGSNVYISKSAIPKGVGNVVSSEGVKTLMILVELFQGKKRREEYEKQYGNEGIRYEDLKEKLSRAIYRKLEPIQKKRKKYENDPKLVRKILDEGAEKARKVAKETLREVKEAMGLA